MGLLGISPLISPDLLHALASMGHGDDIVFADAHFPTSSICRSGPKELRCDGQKIPELLNAVLPLFPLDTYAEAPIFLMDLVASDKNKRMPEPPVWSEYRSILTSYCTNLPKIRYLERFEFYEHAKRAFAVVHTGETAKYGNIILRKGCLDLSGS